MTDYLLCGGVPPRFLQMFLIPDIIWKWKKSYINYPVDYKMRKGSQAL